MDSLGGPSRARTSQAPDTGFNALGGPSSSGPSTGGTSSSSRGPHLGHYSTASSSSYAPVLIKRSPDKDLHLPSLPNGGEGIPAGLALRYPYPLPIASLLDLAYTIHHHYVLSSLSALSPGHTLGVAAGTAESATSTGAGLLLTAAGCRAVVLVLVVGCSRRWRARGGWVAAVCGISVGAGIWEDCAERLGARGGHGGRVGHERGPAGHAKGGGGGQSWFLYMTILICISEYILYLLLLRLSPPSHRSHPFSLRPPREPRQTDVPFAFHSEDLEYTPKSARIRRYSSARPRGGVRAGPGPGQRSQAVSPASRRGDGGRGVGGLFGAYRHHASQGALQAGLSSGAHYANHELDDEAPHAAFHSDEEYDHDDRYDEDGFSVNSSSDVEDDASETSSLFSESSIIDLPPPLSPHRIIPPSLSVTSGLALALTDRSAGQPILGSRAGGGGGEAGGVRRSGSARFLGRSWGSVLTGPGSVPGPGLGAGDGGREHGEMMGWVGRRGREDGAAAGGQIDSRGGRGGVSIEASREGSAERGYGTFTP